MNPVPAALDTADERVDVRTARHQCVSHDGADPQALDLAHAAEFEATLAVTGATVRHICRLLSVLCSDLERPADSRPGRREILDKTRRVRRVAEGGGMLLRELRALTGSDAASFCPANHVAALAPLLRRTLRSDCSIHVHAPADGWAVAASAVRFGRALTNLVLYVQDADAAREIVEIHVEHVVLDSLDAAFLQISPGDYVCLRVLNDGTGIASTALPRLTDALLDGNAYDPGLDPGLTVVRSFVESHGGAMEIDSTVGRPTEVCLWLPRCTDDTATTVSGQPPAPTIARGNGKVLLSTRESDAGVLWDNLEALGYNVVPAELGKPLPKEAQTEPLPSLLLCDRSAGMAAEEARWVSSLKLRCQGLRHVAVVAADDPGADIAADADAVVQRPVVVEHLAAAVKAALENGR